MKKILLLALICLSLAPTLAIREHEALLLQDPTEQGTQIDGYQAAINHLEAFKNNNAECWETIDAIWKEYHVKNSGMTRKQYYNFMVALTAETDGPAVTRTETNAEFNQLDSNHNGRLSKTNLYDGFQLYLQNLIDELKAKQRLAEEQQGADETTIHITDQ